MEMGTVRKTIGGKASKMPQLIVTEVSVYQSCSTRDHTDIYTLILRMLSNNHSINHKLALWVLCKNNVTIPEQTGIASFHSRRVSSKISDQSSCMYVCYCVGVVYVNNNVN